MLDTGAEVSIIPPELKHLGELTPVKRPFTLGGFSGKRGHKITEKVKLEVDFVGARLIGYFFVCPTKCPMMGSDYFKLFPQHISLNTGNAMLKLDGKEIKTDRNIHVAEQSLLNRQKGSANCELGLECWATVTRKAEIAAYEISDVEVTSAM